MASSQAGTFPAKAITYDPSGNVTKKSDICNTTNCFVYGAGAGPHALTGIVGTYNGVTNPAFLYDANGNLTSGGGRTMTWTSFNMAATIAEGANTMAFVYDSAHNRIKACVPNCASPAATTYYLNDGTSGAMSEKVISGSTTVWHDYVQAGGDIVAERFNISGTISWRYFALDHLGSTVVLTDQSGTVQERLAYDPWGKRRNANGSDSATCSITSATSRGFTGHEMIDAMCMINMNARLYDPALGRFTSADDIAPGTNNGQKWNLYAYTNNRPTAFVDPTGHTGVRTIPKKVWGDNGLPCLGCTGTTVSVGGSGSVGLVTTSQSSLDPSHITKRIDWVRGWSTSQTGSTAFGFNSSGFGSSGRGQGVAALENQLRKSPYLTSQKQLDHIYAQAEKNIEEFFQIEDALADLAAVLAPEAGASKKVFDQLGITDKLAKMLLNETAVDYEYRALLNQRLRDLDNALELQEELDAGTTTKVGDGIYMDDFGGLTFGYPSGR